MTEVVSNDPEMPPLTDLEVQLTDVDELVFRQCNPKFLESGSPSSQVFKESTGDVGKLSGARSSKTTAEAAFNHRRSIGGNTVGTFAVSVDEIHSCGSRAVDDSAYSKPDDPPGHTYIDVRHLSPKGTPPSKRSVAAHLAIAARNRGLQWPTDSINQS